ncbi:hypothetical protein C490_12407 [Natronobacterium gregoryi SP2]|uniref:Uncharacterized protein n=1 Tax=Natronobacterium gregoryi (strain ATCC 43098 / DSM 3393 / CCM 3738 / CIP 104747 / IAM 13177 / JCM 8860 / NBRC 102187 / NCIMB 2189 / SP2) TaxID=797304 RepID=L9XYL5_NATGS|nr:hypothetical protein C490_12407 [Natronobacterium gregoryi SP2]
MRTLTFVPDRNGRSRWQPRGSRERHSWYAIVERNAFSAWRESSRVCWQMTGDVRLDDARERVAVRERFIRTAVPMSRRDREPPVAAPELTDGKPSQDLRTRRTGSASSVRRGPSAHKDQPVADR